MHVPALSYSFWKPCLFYICRYRTGFGIEFVIVGMLRRFGGFPHLGRFGGIAYKILAEVCRREPLAVLCRAACVMKGAWLQMHKRQVGPMGHVAL